MEFGNRISSDGVLKSLSGIASKSPKRPLNCPVKKYINVSYIQDVCESLFSSKKYFLNFIHVERFHLNSIPNKIYENFLGKHWLIILKKITRAFGMYKLYQPARDLFPTTGRMLRTVRLASVLNAIPISVKDTIITLFDGWFVVICITDTPRIILGTTITKNRTRPSKCII